MLDPIQYEFLFLFTTLAGLEPGPGAGAETSIFRLWLQPKFWFLAAPAPQHWFFPHSHDRYGLFVTFTLHAMFLS
jgi:hypothetical protein